MRIKILELVGQEYCDDNYSETVYHKHDTTEWEDVSEDDHAALVLWVQHYNTKNYPKRVVLITEKMIDYKKTAADYLEKAKEIKNDLLEKEKKRKAAEDKRKADAAKKKEQQAKKLIERAEKVKKELGWK